MNRNIKKYLLENLDDSRNLQIVRVGTLIHQTDTNGNQLLNYSSCKYRLKKGSEYKIYKEYFEIDSNLNVVRGLERRTNNIYGTNTLEFRGYTFESVE